MRNGVNEERGRKIMKGATCILNESAIPSGQGVDSAVVLRCPNQSVSDLSIDVNDVIARR